MKKYLIGLIVLIISYFMIDFFRVVVLKDYKKDEIFTVMKKNPCGQENDGYVLCRMDLIGDRHVVSIGLPERYSSYLNKQKIRIRTGVLDKHICLKQILILDDKDNNQVIFNEKFPNCSFVYVKNRNDI